MLPNVDSAVVTDGGPVVAEVVEVVVEPLVVVVVVELVVLLSLKSQFYIKEIPVNSSGRSSLLKGAKVLLTT